MAMGANHETHLVVVPISFVSDNIETLHEIDIEYQELAHESGIPHWRRAAVVNANPRFVNEMADIVADTLRENSDGSLLTPIMTVADAIKHTNVGPPERLAATAGFNSEEQDASSESSMIATITNRLPATEDALNGAAHLSALALVSAVFSNVFAVKLEYVLTCVFGAVLSIFLS